MRLWSVCSVVVMSVLLVACDEQANGGTTSGMVQERGAAQPLMMAADMSSSRSVAGFRAKSEARMQIDRSYDIEISQGDVGAALETDRAVCLKLGCVITAQHTATFDGRPNATLSALVPLDKVQDFHAHLTETSGREVMAFNETAQNRQEQHQNLKSRLERLEFMRKRLYTLAEQKSDEVGDLLQVERELLRVDTDIERLTRERKGLEKVTDNVTFTITYRPRPPKAGDVDFSPLSGLLGDMANTFVWGIRALALWTARWLPVVILVLIGAYVVRRRLVKSGTDTL